jgi:hypothetical protein
VYLPTPLDFLRQGFQNSCIIFKNFASKEIPEYLYDSRCELSANTMMHPKFDGMIFARAASILDKAVADYGSLHFSASILAAAALWIFFDEIDINDAAYQRLKKLETFHDYGIKCKDSKVKYRNILSIATTGYRYEVIESCVNFLEPYPPCNIEDIVGSAEMIEWIKKWREQNSLFRVEEDLIPCYLEREDYGTAILIIDGILRNRAYKNGVGHVDSQSWIYSN